MEIRAISGIGHEFGRETGASVADGKSNLVIVRGAFELYFARAAFLAAVANRVRYAFGKREQHIMAYVIGHAGAVELLARPFVDLLQLVKPAGYEKMIHYAAEKILYAAEKILHRIAHDRSCALLDDREIVHQIEEFGHSRVRDLGECLRAFESMLLVSFLDEAAYLRYGVGKGLLQFGIALGIWAGPLHKEKRFMSERRIEKQVVALCWLAGESVKQGSGEGHNDFGQNKFRRVQARAPCLRWRGPGRWPFPAHEVIRRLPLEQALRPLAQRKSRSW